MIPIFFAWYTKLDFRATFNLNGFKPLSFFGVIILCFGILGVVLWTGMIQTQYFHETNVLLETLRKIVDIKSTNVNPVVLFLVIVVSPATCEELLFRGMILSGFRQHVQPILAVLIISFLFAIAHANIFRFMPVFVLGISLTFIALRTRSIFLSMIAHCIHNGILITSITNQAIANHLGWLYQRKLSLPIWAVLIIFGCTSIIFSTKNEWRVKKNS